MRYIIAKDGIHTATVDMSEQEIKEANTGTHVFIQLFVTPIDAMEDVAVDIYL